MATDDTIRQQAHRLVSAHGEDAPIQAAMQAQDLLDRGDLAGGALWGLIGKKTNVLLSKTAHAAAVDPASPQSLQPVESVNEIPTLSDLPMPDIKRWHFQQKATVVTAVRTGLINVAEACARYSITIEEFLSWKRLLDEHGVQGLRATRLQEYRHEATRASGSSGDTEELETHGSGS
jgi:transposase-like protein